MNLLREHMTLRLMTITSILKGNHLNRINSHLNCKQYLQRKTSTEEILLNRTQIISSNSKPQSPMTIRICLNQKRIIILSSNLKIQYFHRPHHTHISRQIHQPYHLSNRPTKYLQAINLLNSLVNLNNFSMLNYLRISSL